MDKLISLELFEKMIYDDCFYCGSPPRQTILDGQFKGVRTSDKSITVNGIDRIDSSVGYVDGNVVTCCKYCNTAKSSLTQDEFKLLISNIYRHYVVRW